jgi:hypothetical protein
MADLVVMMVNKLRGRPALTPLTGPITDPTVTQPAPPLTEREASIEQRRLLTMLPVTQEFVKGILTWVRERGMPCILGETHRGTEAQAEAARKGRTAIPEGQTGWHQYGRAFHVIVYKSGTRQIDPDAYRLVGEEVRRRGGEWLGDKLLKTPKGEVFQDLAHFEYHPGLHLSSYRGSSLAKQELATTERRAARYG